EKTFLRRDRRDEVDAEPRVEQRVGGSGPDRGGPSGPAARAVGELSRRVGARDEQPVIDFELDAIRADGLDPDERADDDLVPELPDPRGERLLLPCRTRDDHAHAGSVSGAAAGGTPRPTSSSFRGPPSPRLGSMLPANLCRVCNAGGRDCA